MEEPSTGVLMPRTCQQLAETRSVVRQLVAPVAVLLALLFSALSAQAQQAQWESHARLQQAAATALAEEGVSIGLDPNTRVPQCQSAPVGRVRSRSRNNASVEISCSRPAWRIFVPARSNATAMVAVLQRAVPAGSVFTADDFSLQPRDTSVLGYGWLDDSGEIIGRTARRALPAGSIIGPNDLQREVLVATGDTVTLISRASGIEVRMRGQALSQGSMAQQIRVRNINSGRTVDGTVIAAGEVEISP